MRQVPQPMSERTTTRGLEPEKTSIRITNAPGGRKNACGTFVRHLTHAKYGEMVQYRSFYNGCLYYAPLANVSVEDRAIEKRRRATVKKLRKS